MNFPQFSAICRLSGPQVRKLPEMVRAPGLQGRRSVISVLEIGYVRGSEVKLALMRSAPTVSKALRSLQFDLKRATRVVHWHLFAGGAEGAMLVLATPASAPAYAVGEYPERENSR